MKTIFDDIDLCDTKRRLIRNLKLCSDGRLMIRDCCNWIDLICLGYEQQMIDSAIDIIQTELPENINIDQLDGLIVHYYRFFTLKNHYAQKAYELSSSEINRYLMLLECVDKMHELINTKSE